MCVLLGSHTKRQKRFVRGIVRWLKLVQVLTGVESSLHLDAARYLELIRPKLACQKSNIDISSPSRPASRLDGKMQQSGNLFISLGNPTTISFLKFTVLVGALHGQFWIYLAIILFLFPFPFNDGEKESSTVSV